MEISALVPLASRDVVRLSNIVVPVSRVVEGPGGSIASSDIAEQSQADGL